MDIYINVKVGAPVACDRHGRGARLGVARYLHEALSLIVVFDIGNVLLRWNRPTSSANGSRTRRGWSAFFDRSDMDFVSHTDIAPDFAGAVAARATAFPEFADELRLFHERWIETIGGPIEENVALLRRLKAAGRPVHALSNFAAETFALVEEQYDFLGAFDTRVISGHVGVVKPDPRIYEILFERAGRRASELLFIDDSAANVRASEAQGCRRFTIARRRSGERTHCPRRVALITCFGSLVALR